MKNTSNPISPFLMLLIPALFIIGLKASASTEADNEKYNSNTCFQLPALKGAIKAFLIK